MKAVVHKKHLTPGIVKLSLVTVVKNDSMGLLDTMVSIKDGDLKYSESIVWINSNTDNIKKHVEIAKKYANIVVSGHDSGIFDAMNKSMSFASGDFVLFLNARDKILEAFSVEEITRPSLISVQYIDFFNRIKQVKVRKSLKMGIPYCHQGMILPRTGYYYDANLKYGADYLALLEFGLSWPLPMLKNGLIEYDNSGVSSINRWESDKYTANIIKRKFGYFFALLFTIKSLSKLLVKKIYNVKIVVFGF